jgi:hypothetical protein
MKRPRIPKDFLKSFSSCGREELAAPELPPWGGRSGTLSGEKAMSAIKEVTKEMQQEIRAHYLAQARICS